MDREQAYAYIEELDKREVMEVLDTVINRFRELYDDRELIVLSLKKGESRNRELEELIHMLKRESEVRKEFL